MSFLLTIEKDKSKYLPPYDVVIHDMTDRVYYVNTYPQEGNLYGEYDDFKLARANAYALFVLGNSYWKSLDEMNSCDGGFDIRVYDQSSTCVYAAHTSFLKRWIGK